MRTLKVLLLLLVPVWAVAQTPVPGAISPDKPGNDSGRTYLPSRANPAEVVLRMPKSPLRLDSVAVVLLEDGTAVGNPGDCIIVVWGDGFWETEYAPRVHLNKTTVLEETMVGAGGSVLYATLPAAQASAVKALKIREIQVQNPGGLDLDPKRWARLPLPDGLNAKIATAKPGAFQVEGYLPVLVW